MPPGSHPLFLSSPAGVVLPLRVLAGGAGLEALSTPYTGLYQPLASPRVTDAALRAAGEAFGRFCRSWGRVRLDAMDGEWPGLVPLLQGMREAGLVVLRFAHFGNWHAAVSGLSWADYLAARPGALRETIRRRGRGCGVEMIRSADGLEAGIAAYEAVYGRSWKPAEPFPRFGAALMRAAAAEGVLRLGVLRVAGRPVAAQYWVVSGGTASLLKLAHDEAEKGRSPGTVLTAAMIRALLEQDGVAELDFGRGDDAYKALWAGSRRQRIGVLLVNPWRAAGLAALGRHVAGRVLARATRRAVSGRSRPDGGIGQISGSA